MGIGSKLLGSSPASRTSKNSRPVWDGCFYYLWDLNPKALSKAPGEKRHVAAGISYI